MRLSRVALFFLALPLWPGMAWCADEPVAPTPPFVPTPRDLTPAEVRAAPRPAEEASGALGPVPRELGKPEEEITLDVASYAVPETAPAALRAALPRLTAPFTGKGRSFEDIVNAASEVTRFLQRDLGYYLGYAYIPEQVPKDGVIRIAVLEGRLDRVVLNWTDGLPVRKEVVQAYLDRLKPGAILTVQDVERAVFLVNDLRGISVKAEVRSGDQPGTAILEFTPKADPKVTGKIDADINGSRFIGTTRLGGLVSFNSPLGRGDGLSFTGLASTSGGLKFGLLGYSTPLGSDGFKAGLSYSLLKYELDPQLFPLKLSGTGTTTNLFGLYPWVRSRNLNLFLVPSFDDKRYRDSISRIVTDKRVDDLTLGVTGDFRDSFATGGVNTFQATFMAGALHIPGGIPGGLDDAAHFRKLEMGFTRLQNIVDGKWLAYFSTHAQAAFANLDTTEQFRIGGPDGVRAFAPGEGTGDTGAVVTAELRWLPPASLFGKWARELVFAGFADAGEVQFRHDPNLVPRAAGYVNHAYYAGVGLSMVWARPNAYSVRLSLSNPVHGTATGDTLERHPRVYLNGTWNY